MLMARIVLLAGAVMFGILGVWLMVQPTRLEEWTGIVANLPAARTEIRAFYGGLETGLAAFLVWALARPTRLEAGCIGLAAFSLGTAAGRVVGLLADGSAEFKVLCFLGIELALGLAALTGWQRARKTIG